MKSKISQIAQGLSEAQSVTLVSHIAPDGDTAGAVCAVALGLERLGKKVTRYCSDKIPARLTFLPGCDRFVQDLEMARASDCILTVDCAAPDRLGLGQCLLELGKPVYVLDHHGSNRGFGDVCYVSDAPSVCEAVQRLLTELGCTLDKEIADCLYTGMVTDTGRFSFSGVTGDTLRLAADTVEAGADYVNICKSQFQCRTLAATKLLGKAIGSMELYFDDRLAIMSVSGEDMAACNGRLEDMEGIVNYASEVEGVQIGIMIYPASGKWKVSLRAGGNARVDTVAQLLGGGGHAKAAGGRAQGTLDEAKAQVINAVVEAKALQ